MKYFLYVKIAFKKILDKTIGAFEMAVLGIIVISTLSYALAYQAPGGNPPAGNTDSPLNVGLNAQIKGGNLVVNALGITASGSALLVPNGNVGIGLTAPSYPLHIKTPTGTAAWLGLTQDTMRTWVLGLTASNSRFYIRDDSSGQDFLNVGAALTAAQYNATTHIWGNAAGSEMMRIDTGGNVGIGTASPAYKLDVFGGSIRANGDVIGGRLCIGGDCRSSWPDSTPPPPPSTPPPSTPPPSTPLYQCPSDERGRAGQCNFDCFGTITTSSTCTHSADYDSCNSEIRQCTPL